MYTARELLGDVATDIARAPTYEAMLDELDQECRRRYHQLQANGEGGTGIRYQFEIRDDTGQVVGGMFLSPRIDLPSLREIFGDRNHRPE